MRTAALPSFRKLYGRIEEDLHAEDVLDIKIMNNYNTYSFGGTKKLVISTSSWLGGETISLDVPTFLWDLFRSWFLYSSHCYTWNRGNILSHCVCNVAYTSLLTCIYSHWALLHFSTGSKIWCISLYRYCNNSSLYYPAYAWYPTIAFPLIRRSCCPPILIKSVLSSINKNTMNWFVMIFQVL